MPEPTSASLAPLPTALREAIRRCPLPALDDAQPQDAQPQDAPPQDAQPEFAIGPLLEQLQQPGCGLPSEPPSDADAARACESALWLLGGDLDRSHHLSQSLDSPDGSFWHGVMHRREGDFGNAKYWFRRTGHHPAYRRLATAIAADPLARAVSKSDTAWDALAFVDACAEAIRRGGEAREACVQAQWLEWQVMFEDCLNRAWPQS